MYARNIKFTTTSNDEEILNLSNVQEVLKSMLNAKTEDEYRMLMANGIDTNVDIFTANTRIKINNTTYNDLIENSVYSTNNITKIYSIKSELPTTGVIVFTMADL